MGERRGPYVADFPIGSRVRIAARDELEEFCRTWKYHHPLAPEQIPHGGRVAVVLDVSFYHGGDELYVLEDVPGIWHERCLRNVDVDADVKGGA